MNMKIEHATRTATYITLQHYTYTYIYISQETRTTKKVPRHFNFVIFGEEENISIYNIRCFCINIVNKKQISQPIARDQCRTVIFVAGDDYTLIHNGHPVWSTHNGFGCFIYDHPFVNWGAVLQCANIGFAVFSARVSSSSSYILYICTRSLIIPIIICIFC